MTKLIEKAKHEIIYGNDFHIEFDNGKVIIRGPTKNRRKTAVIVLDGDDFLRTIKGYA